MEAKEERSSSVTLVGTLFVVLTYHFIHTCFKGIVSSLLEHGKLVWVYTGLEWDNPRECCAFFFDTRAVTVVVASGE